MVIETDTSNYPSASNFKIFSLSVSFFFFFLDFFFYDADFRIKIIYKMIKTKGNINIASTPSI